MKESVSIATPDTHLFAVDAVVAARASPAALATSQARGTEAVAGDRVAEGRPLALAPLLALLAPLALGAVCELAFNGEPQRWGSYSFKNPGGNTNRQKGIIKKSKPLKLSWHQNTNTDGTVIPVDLVSRSRHQSCGRMARRHRTCIARCIPRRRSRRDRLFKEKHEY